MKIIVLMKMVQNPKNPDYEENTFRIRRDPEESIINYDDGNALEMALKLKDQGIDGEKVEITVLTMGAKGSEKILEEAYALGVDEAYLIQDDQLTGADTLLTARCLSAAISKLKDYDIILTGYKSQDGKTGSVGPMVAEYLGIPLITYVNSFYWNEGKVIAAVDWEDYEEVTATAVPCLLVINQKKYDLRRMTLRGIQRSLKMEIFRWTLEDLNGAEGNDIEITPKTAITRVLRTSKDRKRMKIKFEEDEGEEPLINLLSEIKCNLNKLL